MAIALLLASCTPDARTLTVDVRTDWLPGLEFDAVRTTLGTGTGDRFTPSAGTYSVAATDRQDFGEGRRVAEINGLEAGQHAVRVELLTGGATLATRDTIVDLSGSFSLIVLITSSCADVECPGPTDPPENIECNGGYCVDPRCSPEQPELCDPGCTSDTECPTTSECTTGVCDEGACLQRADDGLCPAGLRCSLRRGCVMPRTPDGGVAAACDATLFDDVDASNPFCPEITWAANRGLVDGFADGGFHPVEVVTREVVAALLYRLSGASASTCDASLFDDVDATNAFCAEITWAAGRGIVNGYADGTFRPAEGVTRQAMAVFLYRLAGATSGCDGTRFDDVSDTHPFCAEITWVASQGIASGYADGGFHPAADLTRQAAASILYNYDQR